MTLAHSGIEILQPDFDLWRRLLMRVVAGFPADVREMLLFGEGRHGLFLQKLLRRAFGGTQLVLARFTEGPLRGRLLECWSSERYFLLGSAYEREAQALARNLVRTGDTVYDVGGHAGFMALLFSQLCGAEGYVYAFEPSPENFQRLTRTIALNDLKNIEPVKLAVSDQTQRGRILECGSMSRVLPLDAATGPEIETVRLDEFVYRDGHRAPTFIKVDVEGHGGRVLAGMRSVLASAKPVVLCELHDFEEAELVREILQAHDYRIAEVARCSGFPQRIVARPAAVRTVSVIIPTKDRPNDLRTTVESILRQTCVPQELIIVDQSTSAASRRSVDEAVQQAGSQIRLRYVHDATISGGAQARNRAMQMANEEVLLFLDDDVTLEPDFVTQILDVYHRHPEATGISGVITNYTRPAWHSRWWRKLFARGKFHDPRQSVYWRASRRRSAELIRVDRLGAGLMSFPRKAIRGAWFDNSLRGVCDGEDVDFCARLGDAARLMISSAARLTHHQSPQGRLCGHWLRREVRAAHFLYHKNWRTGIANRLCFAWLNLGYAFLATAGSLKRFSLEPWRAYLTGMREARQGTQNR